MQFNFDELIDRRSSDSIKWHSYNEDVLPMWVADMDFRSPQPVIDALQQRVDHGVFGYAHDVPGLKDAILNWLKEQYKWQVQAEDIVYVPGVVPGFNMAAQSLTQPNLGLLIQTPVYMPFLEVADNANMQKKYTQLNHLSNGRYEIDFDAFEDAVADHTGMFLLCNPHNPVGRVYNREELERMADICLRHKCKISVPTRSTPISFTAGNSIFPWLPSPRKWHKTRSPCLPPARPSISPGWVSPLPSSPIPNYARHSKKPAEEQPVGPTCWR